MDGGECIAVAAVPVLPGRLHAEPLAEWLDIWVFNPFCVVWNSLVVEAVPEGGYMRFRFDVESSDYLERRRRIFIPYFPDVWRPGLFRQRRRDVIQDDSHDGSRKSVLA